MAGCQIQLFGKFRVLDARGADITPHGAKAAALIAILALEPGLRASRRQLESLLWSTRSTEQASASLRQCLRQIRLQPQLERVVLADRNEIWLQRSAVSRTPPPPGNPPRLLEQPVIRDPAFALWLADQRAIAEEAAIHPKASNTSPDLEVGIELTTDADGLSLAQTLLQLQISHHLLDTGIATTMVSAGHAVLVHRGNVLSLRIDSRPTADGETMTATLTDPASGRLHWTRSVSAPTPAAAALDTPLLRFATQSADAVLRAAGDTDPSAPARHARALIDLALREVFKFQPTNLDRADALLAQAHRLHPQPLAQVWRSFIRMVMYAEQMGQSQHSLIDAADDYLCEALYDAGENSLVLSVASQVKGLLYHDDTAAQSLAEQALAINPGSAMAHDSASIAALRRGDVIKSLQHAKLASEIGAHSPIRHLWHLGHCLALIRTGDYLGAARAAEASLVSAPNYRPPLRHLYALYLYLENPRAAAAKLDALRRLEPDFSLQRLRDDEDYPGDVIRHSPLIELPDLEGR